MHDDDLIDLLDGLDPVGDDEAPVRRQFVAARGPAAALEPEPLGLAHERLAILLEEDGLAESSAAAFEPVSRWARRAARASIPSTGVASPSAATSANSS